MTSSALQIPAAIKSSSSAFFGRLPSTSNIGFLDRFNSLFISCSSITVFSQRMIWLQVVYGISFGQEKWGLQVRGCTSCGTED
ncbi:hypothetical protein BHM03_00014110 [Ensete ventricosum]|nr:hypothetical protein BHM03_00014110 [Ensete ventricosum]